MLDLQAHLDHLLKAGPEDQVELLQRVAALAWNAGYNAGLEQSQTMPYTPNPYSAK